MTNNDNDETDQGRHRLRVKLLFGLFEADATGGVAIGAALLCLLIVGGGRWATIW